MFFDLEIDPKTTQDGSKMVLKPFFFMLNVVFDFGAFWNAFYTFLGRILDLKIDPKSNQKSFFVMRQHTPKRPFQEALPEAPRSPQEAAKTTPQDPQDAPRRLQEGPKTPLDPPKWPQECSKMACRDKFPPRGSA